MDEIQPGTEWERVNKLCEFNSKKQNSAKDMSRMRLPSVPKLKHKTFFLILRSLSRSILLQLKQNPKQVATN